MFEVGFTEIVLILGLALLVLGPEKLPGLAQKVGRWTGRARAMARQLRTQLEQEVTLEEVSRSRPATSQTPPEPTIHADGAADTPPVQSTAHSGHGQTDASEPPATPPRHEPELDLDRNVSGIEPDPAPAAAASEPKNVA